MNQSDIAYTRAFVPQYRTITDAAGRPIARGIQAVIQHFPDSAVYGLLYLDEQAIRQTLATRHVHHYNIANGCDSELLTAKAPWKIADIYTNCVQDCWLIRAGHPLTMKHWHPATDALPQLMPAVNHDDTPTSPLLPIILQDAIDGQILFVASMNEDALRQTRTTGRIHVYSRTAQRVRCKGVTSGDYLAVIAEYIHETNDCALMTVRREGVYGGVCHVKRPDGCAHATCFYRVMACEWGREKTYYYTSLDV